MINKINLKINKIIKIIKIKIKINWKINFKKLKIRKKYFRLINN